MRTNRPAIKLAPCERTNGDQCSVCKALVVVELVVKETESLTEIPCEVRTKERASRREPARGGAGMIRRKPGKRERAAGDSSDRIVRPQPRGNGGTTDDTDGTDFTDQNEARTSPLTSAVSSVKFVVSL